jgi:hypothetical protein
MPLKLNVSYQEKEEAKSKGAFWDTEHKTWYVPNHKNYNDFLKWIDTDNYSIIAKPPFYVALNKRICWKCSEVTQVIALASNTFYELDDENDASPKWFEQDYFSFFNMPKYINPEVIQRVQQKFPFYKFGYSKTINGKYWANHCQKCNALQGDFFNHNEPGGAFFPISIEECRDIKLYEVPSKFDLTLNAGTAISSNEDMILENATQFKWN